MKVLCLIGVAFILCGCDSSVYVSQNGLKKCDYSYESSEYTFDSIQTTDATNGDRDVTIHLKKRVKK